MQLYIFLECINVDLRKMLSIEFLNFIVMYLRTIFLNQLNSYNFLSVLFIYHYFIFYNLNLKIHAALYKLGI